MSSASLQRLNIEESSTVSESSEQLSMCDRTPKVGRSKHTGKTSVHCGRLQSQKDLDDPSMPHKCAKLTSSPPKLTTRDFSKPRIDVTSKESQPITMEQRNPPPCEHVHCPPEATWPSNNIELKQSQSQILLIQCRHETSSSFIDVDEERVGVRTPDHPTKKRTLAAGVHDDDSSNHRLYRSH
jgi:hypothetical protein